MLRGTEWGKRNSVHQLGLCHTTGHTQSAGRASLLLRDSYSNPLEKSGIEVPAGTSPHTLMGAARTNHTPDCQKIMAAVHAGAVSVARADASEKAVLSAVSAGMYYLMIPARYNKQPLVWGKPVQLKAGENTLSWTRRHADAVGWAKRRKPPLRRRLG